MYINTLHIALIQMYFFPHSTLYTLCKHEHTFIKLLDHVIRDAPFFQVIIVFTSPITLFSLPVTFALPHPGFGFTTQ